ncbi:hypothetical protein ACQY0O_005737 [Thecaphora frezii]
MSTSPAHQNAVSSLASALPPKLQRRPFHFLILAGLGTTSLFLAQRLLPPVWTLFTSALGRSSHAAASTSNNNAATKSTKARSVKNSTKDNADPVAIFWDVDNCAPPTGSSGRAVAQAIRTSMQNLDLGPIVSFKAYLELSSETLAPNAQQVQLRSELQGSGVSLIDTPKSGRKDVADKMMITDLLAFAIDQPAPATIVLISGDRDFAYPLGLLRNRGYEIILITPPVGAVPILEASANVVLTWRQDVLGVERASNGRPYNSTHAPSTPSKGSQAAASAASNNHPTPASTSSAPSGPYGSLSNDRPSTAPSRSSRRPSVQSTEVFQPLISLLEQLKKEGNPKPLRAAVAARLVSSDRGVYVRAGASRWAEYAAVAEAAGIIQLGTSGPPGTEWVGLADSYATAATTAAAQARARVGPPGTPAQSSPIPNRSKPVPAAGATTTTPSDPSVADIRAFYPLIEICKEQKAQGNPKPLSAYVGTQLTLMARQGIVDAYGMAGVSSWRDYIAAAERAGVARASSYNSDGVYVVELHPKYLYAQTNQPTPSAGRIPDTATTPTPSIEKKAGKKGMMNSLGSFSLKPSMPSKDVVLPTGTSLFNGHEIPAKFCGMAQVLLEQMNEGRNYSTDYFLHSIIGSSRATHGLRLKNTDEFQAFVEEAVSEQIITTETGFKPGVRHVRLHPRIIAPGPMTELATDAALSRSRSVDCAAATAIGARRETSGSNGKGKEREATEKQKRTQEMLQQLSWEREQAAEAVRTSSGVVPPNDRLRFKILVDILTELRSSQGSTKVNKARVSSELVKRNPGPGGMGAFYQTLGSTGFTDYVEQARKAGFVVVGRDEGGGEAAASWPIEGDYWIRLSSRYESMFFSS